MKRLLMLAVATICAVCCGPRTDKVYDGRFVPDGERLHLPMSAANGKTTYSIDIDLSGGELVLASPRMLATCYVSFLYDVPVGGRDVMDVDLDFIDLVNGKYVYSIPYGWLPSKLFADKIRGVTFFYAPADAALPLIEEKGADGTVQLSYPDFTGYKFMFQSDEVGKYLGPLLEKLR